MGRLVTYYLISVIAFFAMVMGTSDNAYLALAALFMLLPLFVFKNYLMIWRYIVMVATFFSVVQCIDWINLYYKGDVLGIEGLFSVISKLNILLPLVFLLWAVVIIIWIWESKKKNFNSDCGNWPRISWALFVFLSFAAVCL